MFQKTSYVINDHLYLGENLVLKSRSLHEYIQYMIDWLIDFSCMSNRLGLFYTKSLGNRVHFTFIFTFFVS